MITSYISSLPLLPPPSSYWIKQYDTVVGNWALELHRPEFKSNFRQIQAV